MLVFSGSPDAGLQYTVCVNPVHLETLHLNVVPKKNFGMCVCDTSFFPNVSNNFACPFPTTVNLRM